MLHTDSNLYKVTKVSGQDRHGTECQQSFLSCAQLSLQHSTGMLESVTTRSRPWWRLSVIPTTQDHL